MNEVFIIITNDNQILEVCKSEQKANRVLSELFELYYDLKPQIMRKKLV